MELGQLFAQLGTRVTIVEILDRLAPFDEPEVSAAIENVLEDEGTGVVTGATVTRVRTEGWEVREVADSGPAVHAEISLTTSRGRASRSS